MAELFGSIGMTVIAAIIGGTVSLIKSFKFVHEGELGIRLRFGKAVCKKGKPFVIKPGLIILIPFVDTLRRRHVRQQTLSFTRQRIVLSDGLIFEVSAIVLFKVVDVYKALFEIDNLDDSISDLCMSFLREEISSYDHLKLAKKQEEISERLLEKVQDFSNDWGIEFFRFSLTDCAPTPETANLINVEVGSSLRVKALIKSAEELNLSLDNMPPSLQAVLVGIPLVASLGETYNGARSRSSNEEN